MCTTRRGLVRVRVRARVRVRVRVSAVTFEVDLDHVAHAEGMEAG